MCFLAANEYYKICPDNSIDDWRVELINLAPNMFSTASCLNVTLFLFLRYLQESRLAEKISNVRKLTVWTIITSWLISFFVNLLGVLAQVLGWWNFYFYYRYLRLYIFWTFPVLLVICMYLRLFYQMLRKTKQARENVRETMKTAEAQAIEDKLTEKAQQMTRSIQIIVICLVICFLPYLGWLNYYYYNFWTRTGHYKVYPYEVGKIECSGNSM